MNNGTTIEMGWFERLKTALHFDDLMEKLDLSWYKLLDMALFLGIGFLIGFLWKRYANYVIALLFFCALLFVLSQLNILSITFNWVKIQQCCGVEPAVPDSDLVALLWNWMKNNILILFSFIIGLCFGAKVS